MSVGEVDVGASSQLIEQDGFEQVLREIAQGRRRELQRLCALTFERQAAEFLAGERGHPQHLPGVRRILARRVDRLHVDPGGAEDFEGTRVDHMRRRRGLRRRPPLDDAARDSQPRQEERAGHPGRARADDQHRGLAAGHERISDLVKRISLRRSPNEIREPRRERRGRLSNTIALA
jgi:hypothetical protein